MINPYKPLTGRIPQCRPLSLGPDFGEAKAYVVTLVARAVICRPAAGVRPQRGLGNVKAHIASDLKRCVAVRCGSSCKNRPILIGMLLSLSFSSVIKRNISGLFWFIFVFSIQLTENNAQYKFWQWRESNPGPLLSEVTALPTEHNHCPNFIKKSCHSRCIFFIFVFCKQSINAQL